MLLLLIWLYSYSWKFTRACCFKCLKNFKILIDLAYWQKKCIAWMHSKLLWIKASVKCIKVNVNLIYLISTSYSSVQYFINSHQQKIIGDYFIFLLLSLTCRMTLSSCKSVQYSLNYSLKSSIYRLQCICVLTVKNIRYTIYVLHMFKYLSCCSLI